MHIVQRGVVRIDAAVPALEIRVLQGDTHIKEERQRVDGGIRCRVLHVQAVSFAES